MSFNYTISLTDPYGLPQDAALRLDMAAALDAWSRSIAGSGSLSVSLTVTNLDAGVLAQGGPGTVVAAGRDGARTIYDSGALYELNTGIDPNGSAADISIDISVSALRNGFYVNPIPAAGGSVPADRYDAVTVLTHEVGHALGIVGYRDATGALDAGAESPWDRLVFIQPDGGAVFTGGHAEAVYGGPVPVTTIHNGEEYYHLGNSDAEAASADLMGGTGLPPGQARSVSVLDLAILQDLGAHLAGPVAGLPSDTAADIDAVYVAVLQRPASAADEAGWLAREATGVSADLVRATIVSSPEAVYGVDPVIRLYGVAFGRLPDQGGLYANVNAEHATSLTAVAEGFVQSGEFQRGYGSSAVTDAFLEGLYTNALGRTGSAAELAAWHANGADAAQVLVGFAQSSEYVARSDAGVGYFLDAAARGHGVYSGPLVAPPSASDIAAHVTAHDFLV